MSDLEYLKQRKSYDEKAKSAKTTWNEIYNC